MKDILLFIIIVLCMIYILTQIPSYAKVYKDLKHFTYLFNNCTVAKSAVYFKNETDINSRGYMEEVKKAYYRFIATDGNTYIKKLPSGKLFSEGEKIRVYYNKNNPDENCTDKTLTYLELEEKRIIKKMIIPNLIIFVCFLVIILP